MILRKMMLAGLMTATVLGGIAPAYAQSDPGQNGWRGERARGGERSPGGERGDRGARWRNDAAAQPRAQTQAPAQRWQRSPDRPAGGMAPPRPDPNWRGDPVLPQNRAVEEQVRQRQEQRQDQRRDGRQDRRDDRRDWRADRQDDRRDWRSERADGRRDWREDRRDDRQDWRNTDRRWDEQRGRQRDWSDNRRWDGRGADGRNWNDGRRFDDRTRWSNQRRWDNRWRQDRRYDWRGYRSSYGDRYRIGRYYAPRGWDYGYRRFSTGIFLNSLLFSNSYWINDPYQYRLPPSYGTLRWVRYYGDALLVDIRDGYVVDVIHDFFW